MARETPGRGFAVSSRIRRTDAGVSAWLTDNICATIAAVIGDANEVPSTC
jgi:hypothetical protein